MEETASEQFMDIFCQDEVGLGSAPAAYMNYINTRGTLCIIEYLNSNRTRYIEWKPNDVTIDSESEIQDQEWAVVNSVGGRTRTSSFTAPLEASNRSKYVRVNMTEIKSFKVSRNSQKLTFIDGKGDNLCSFIFSSNCDALVGALKGLLRTAPARRDRHRYFVLEDLPETQQLDKSFAELNIFQEQPSDYVWKFVRNFHNRPYETTMEAFSKITDIVYRGPDHRLLDDEVHDILNRSLEAIEHTTTTQSQEEYEVIAHVPKLPERKEYPRGRPFSIEQWRALQDSEGRVEDVDAVKLVIFRGGISSSLRKEVWKYLLEYYPWSKTNQQRTGIVNQCSSNYHVMKLQWQSMSRIQEDHFSDYRDRKSLIEKDVNRTDRTMDYYAGDNNPHLQTLFDILMTYVMYNFDLGYVQGMSDLLSPILYLLDNEVDAFWCFVGFMQKLGTNFDIDQAGMKEQLHQLHTLLAFVEPELANYLDKHDSGNMFFCFRWLLIWFKRELNLDDIMLMWEVLWTGLPCQNFHLLISVAILETEKHVLMENNYGFTEILKHINDLSGNINVGSMISKAEGMYNQIIASEHLTDSVRLIIGVPILGNPSSFDSKEASPDISDLAPSSPSTINLSGDEVTFERAINNSYL